MENTNKLINSTSPYLLQHAHNPVDWYPWGEEALAKSREENKPIILSIGYSSCHWCHVMAHESFEDDSVAEYMNKHFINIKLDREERPDIDNIYMDAVQAMGLRGGWPLNVFLTPEQKPFYGGTYFPKDNWMELLKNIDKAYNENYDKLSESAEQFAKALQASDFSKYQLRENITEITDDNFQQAVSQLEKKFDSKWGGIDKAPKFPMPAVWQYLAAYSHTFDDRRIEDHLLFTLDKIEQGGIYDQLGGGFSRYSVDGQWHVPHFEKMLYDNGQLMSLYANAFKVSGKKEYKRVMIESAEWLKREMMDDSGGFYSALDADSEGVEGKFYVWSHDEIVQLAGENTEIISDYYDVSKHGNWEETNVLRRLTDDNTFAKKWKLTENELEKKISRFKKAALDKRSERIRPGLDSKVISGWNGLALTGLLDAYQATGEGIFIDLAKTNAQFIKSQLIQKEKLLRVKGLSTQGFLEDYAAVIQAFIKYYETTFDESFLSKANELTEHVITSFYDDNEKLFFYTSNESENLIARKKELFDNVIPASNSIMAENLYKLGLMMDKEEYKTLAIEMVKQVSSLVIQEAEYMSYWSLVTLMINHPTSEIIVVGDDTGDITSNFQMKYLPNKILMAGKEETPLPLFEYKSMMRGESTIYVCYDKTCKRPVNHIEEALEQIEK
ncbi:MAG: thioredoxin domain-containing protein [Cyclobacteriaceae bacterium]